MKEYFENQSSNRSVWNKNQEQNKEIKVLNDISIGIKKTSTHYYYEKLYNL